MSVMVAPTNWLPQLYQRYQRFWDQAVPAAGLALLLWASAEATGVYPGEWRIFLAAVVFVLGLVWPRLAYVAFIFLIAPPLYSISIYLAAIVLAVLILSSHWAMRNLSATILVLITPVLLPWRLAATIPLLAGLWWGEVVGALAGGLAALWLKFLAGMAGQPLDLTYLSGWTPTGANIIERFSVFNSLQTLIELVNPFADTSRALLLHVLQVLAWGLAGYLAGWLSRRTWSDRRRDWKPLLSAVPAVGILWASYVFLPDLLNQPKSDVTTRPTHLALWLLAAALVAGALRQFYLYLRRPLFRPLRRQPRRASSFRSARRLSRRLTPARGSLERSSEQDDAEPAFNWVADRRPKTATEVDDDMIMLEMD